MNPHIFIQYLFGYSNGKITNTNIKVSSSKMIIYQSKPNDFTDTFIITYNTKPNIFYFTVGPPINSFSFTINVNKITNFIITDNTIKFTHNNLIFNISTISNIIKTIKETL
jgi:hypothetical protein